MAQTVAAGSPSRPGAAQEATLDLQALNASSAKVGAFYVRVCEPGSYCEGSVQGLPTKSKKPQESPRLASSSSSVT